MLRSRDSPDSVADDNASDYFKVFVDGSQHGELNRQEVLPFYSDGIRRLG